MDLRLVRLRCDRLGDSDGQVRVVKVGAGGETTDVATATLATAGAATDLGQTVTLGADDALALEDGGGRLGEAYDPEEATVREDTTPTPSFRRGAHLEGPLFTLTLHVDAHAPASAAEGVSACHDPAGLDAEPATPTPRGAPGCVHLPDDDPRGWPRIAVALKVPVEVGGRSQRLGVPYLWLRDDRGRGRTRALTIADFDRFYRETRPEPPADLEGYPRRLRRLRAPRHTHVDSWGWPTRLHLPCCYLVGEGDGARALTFDPDRADTWRELTVYNLESGPDGYMSQPGWLPMIERALMLIPVQHQRATRLRNVYLGFTVGAPFHADRPTWPVEGEEYVPPRGGRVVVTGGSNLGRAGGMDEEGRAAVCVTYGALNRPWTHDAETASGVDAPDAIDGAFDDEGLIATTLLHEFGHVFDTSDPTACGDLAGDELAAEQARWGAISCDRHSTVWDRYKDVVGYAGGTQPPGEGLAEAYRRRLTGQELWEGTPASHPCTATTPGIGDEGEAEALANAGGLPTAASARDAFAAIQAYRRSHPDHRVR